MKTFVSIACLLYAMLLCYAIFCYGLKEGRKVQKDEQVIEAAHGDINFYPEN